MGTKLTWFKFFPRDWYTDAKLMTTAASTRGIWMDFLVLMFIEENPQVQGTVDELARLARCGRADVTLFLSDAKRLRFCDLTQNGQTYIIRSRRFVREFGKRQQARERVQEYRDRNANVTPRLPGMNASVIGEADQKSNSALYISSPDLDPDLNSSLNGSSKNVRIREWPADLALTPEMRAYAVERGIDAEIEFEAWRDDCAAHARKYRDWVAAWRNRIRKVPDFKNGRAMAQRPTTGVDIAKRLAQQAREQEARTKQP